jgi:hypothetical protein
MNPDKLEKFVIDNREGFEDLEPDPGLWEKIQPKDEPKVRRINWSGIAWKAAAVVIIFASSYFFHDYMDSRDGLTKEQSKMGQDLEGFDEIQVLKDAEAYYSSMINSREEQIIQILGNDTKILDEIMEEMKELDMNYNQLKNDLKDDIASEEIIEAMVQNYRMKLFILEDILNQLQKTNTQKDEEVNKVRL